MKSLPADFLASLAAHDEPVTLIVIKMQSGDVYIADDEYGPVNGLAADYTPVVENISEEKDGGSLEGLFKPGRLETGGLTINLVYADDTRDFIHGLMTEGLSRNRVELWKWFVDPKTALGTCDPILWNIYAIQDNSEAFAAREDQQLFPIELITLPGSESRKLSVTDDPSKSYDIIIGKAQGMPLQFMESESSRWTELLGDADGIEIDDSYTGLIRVKDATRLGAGQHLINGEKVSLVTASAGYMYLTGRAQSETEAQEHSNGSRIFPVNAIYKYAVCAGPVGSMELLRTSNEKDIYDEDGDLDTEEYRDLYSGGNEILHPELNPAQIWFNERMPWLKKDQDYDIVDKKFYGSSYSRSSLVYCRNSHEINKEGGGASIEIPLRAFSAAIGGVNAYQVTQLSLPSNQGAGTTFQASDTISEGKFTVTQQHGDWQSGTAYTEFRATGDANNLDEGWMTVGMTDRPTGEQFYNYTGRIAPMIGFVEVYCHHMRIDIQIIRILKTGLEITWNQWLDVGDELLSNTFPPSFSFKESPFINNFDKSDDIRFKFLIRVKGKQDTSSYAYVRVGGSYDSASSWYNMGLAWEYNKVQPAEWISPTFGKNLSSRGIFTSAKAVISGTVTNTDDIASGDVIIFENDVEVSRTSASDGGEINTTVDLSAVSWAELAVTEVKIELNLVSLAGSITSDKVKLELTDGVQWLLSYTSNNLDGLQVSYTDQLYVDPVSTRGADWTPARSVQYLAHDYSGWADRLDTTDLDARHAEYEAVGHYLNGKIPGSSDVREAIKIVLNEGVAVLSQQLGFIKLITYISDGNTMPTSSLPEIMRKDNRSMPSRGITLSPNELTSNRLFFHWDKNLSTGIYGGSVIKTDGTDFINDQEIRFELLRSDSVCNSIADFLWNLWRYKYIIQDCEYAAEDALQVEKHDIAGTLGMVSNDEMQDFLIISCLFTHESAKLRRRMSAKLTMFRRQ